MVPQSLNLLASADQPLKILLLSELSPTEETFLAEQIEERIYGNFKIHFVEERSRDSRISINELKNGKNSFRFCVIHPNEFFFLKHMSFTI